MLMQWGVTGAEVGQQVVQRPSHRFRLRLVRLVGRIRASPAGQRAAICVVYLMYVFENHSFFVVKLTQEADNALSVSSLLKQASAA